MDTMGTPSYAGSIQNSQPEMPFDAHNPRTISLIGDQVEDEISQKLECEIDYEWIPERFWHFVREAAELGALKRQEQYDQVLESTNAVLEKQLTGFRNQVQQQFSTIRELQRELESAKEGNSPENLYKLNEYQTGYGIRGEEINRLNYLLNNWASKYDTLEHDLEWALAEADRLDDDLTLATATADEMYRVAHELVSRALVDKIGEGIFGFASR